jgi:hypothetical protein
MGTNNEKKETLINRLLSKGAINQDEARILFDIGTSTYTTLPEYKEFSRICDDIVEDMMPATYPKTTKNNNDDNFFQDYLW